MRRDLPDAVGVICEKGGGMSEADSIDELAIAETLFTEAPLKGSVAEPREFCCFFDHRETISQASFDGCAQGADEIIGWRAGILC